MGGILDPIGSIHKIIAQKKANKANKEATDQQFEFLREQTQLQRDLAREAEGLIAGGSQRAAEAVASGAKAARLQIGRGYNDARNLAEEGFQEGIERLYGTQDATLQALQAAERRGQDYLGQAGEAIQSAAGSVDLTAPIEADAGFRFQQQQGERAIRNAASAVGGRNSGKTLQSLAEFNQGLGATYAQDVFNRRIARRGQNLQAGGAAANLLATQGNLAASEGARQAGVIGATGNRAADLLTRQGLNASGIRLNQATATANLFTGAQSNIANILQQGAAGQANALQGLGVQLSGIAGQQLPLYQQAALSNSGLVNLAIADAFGGDVNAILGTAGNLVGNYIGASGGGK